MELEAMYLIGDFSVKCNDGFENLDKNAVRSKGKLVISKPVKEIELKNIEQQGFPFFSGTIRVASFTSGLTKGRSTMVVAKLNIVCSIAICI